MERSVSWELILLVLGTAYFEYIKRQFLFIDFDFLEPPPVEIQTAVLALMDSQDKTDTVLEQLRQVEFETNQRNLNRKREAEERRIMAENDFLNEDRLAKKQEKAENIIQQLRKIELDTKSRNDERRREAFERNKMGENDFSDRRIFKVDVVKAKYNEVRNLEEELEDKVEMFTTEYLYEKNKENALNIIRSYLPRIKFMTQAGISFSRKSEMLSDEDIISLFKNNRLIYNNSPINSFENEALFEYVRSLP